MVAGLLRRKKNINSKVITFCFLIIFFIFLYFFNNIERVELVNSSGTSYVKAVVNEIVEDNNIEIAEEDILISRNFEEGDM